MLCIIPARGGSQRIPGKNIKPFHGKPIIAYSIEAALESELFHSVWVSSDSEEILGVASQYNAMTMRRWPGTERDEVGTQEVMKAELSRLRSRHYDNFACCLYATAPLITPAVLQDAFRTLVSNDFPYVVGRGYPPSDRIGPGDEGAFYFGYTHAFLTGIPLDIDTTLSSRFFHIDINTPSDWSRAEKLYEERYGQ